MGAWVAYQLTQARPAHFVPAPVALLLQLLPCRPFTLLVSTMPACRLPACLQELARRGGPLPLKLYSSANRSPLLAGAWHDVDPTLMHRLPPADFWAAMDRRYGPNPNLVGSIELIGQG